MLSVILLNVLYAQCLYAECHYAKCRGTVSFEFVKNWCIFIRPSFIAKKVIKSGAIYFIFLNLSSMLRQVWS